METFLLSSLIGVALIFAMNGSLANFIAFELGCVFGGILIWICRNIYNCEV